MNSIFSLASIKKAFVDYLVDHTIAPETEIEWKKFKAKLLEESKPKDKK